MKNWWMVFPVPIRDMRKITWGLGGNGFRATLFAGANTDTQVRFLFLLLFFILQTSLSKPIRTRFKHIRTLWMDLFVFLTFFSLFFYCCLTIDVPQISRDLSRKEDKGTPNWWGESCQRTSVLTKEESLVRPHYSWDTNHKLGRS